VVGLADRSGHRAELGRAGRRVPESMADHVRPLVAVQLREHLRPGERALGEAILRTQRWDGQWQRDLRGKVRRDCVRRRSGGAWRCWRGTRVNASNLLVRTSHHRPKRKLIWSCSARPCLQTMRLGMTVERSARLRGRWAGRMAVEVGTRGSACTRIPKSPGSCRANYWEG